MIVLKSKDEIEIMREANRIVAIVLKRMEEMVRPGVTTAELDHEAEKMILQMGAKPAFKGYLGYKHVLCTSINSEVVHGIPGEVFLKEGDIISIDCGVLYKGFYGDHAWTFPVGTIDAGARRLLETAERALYAGIEEMLPGNRLYDISAAIQKCVEKDGFSVVRDFVGHGVGRELHEDPQVPNFGEAGTGLKLRPGLTVAIEPMVNEGTWKVKVRPDEWTVVTEDGGRSAHFEHSVAVTEEGPKILSIL